MLGALEALIISRFDKTTAEATTLTEAGFPALALSAFAQKRPGMILGEPTPGFLAASWLGFTLGASAVDPALGQRQQEELDAFDRWVRGYYECPHAHWSRAIRVFGGSGLAGLDTFVRLWGEFERDGARS